MKNSESKKKRYQLDLPEELYEKLKAVSDDSGTTMSQKVRNYISIGLWIEKSRRDPNFTLVVRDSSGERILITPL